LEQYTSTSLIFRAANILCRYFVASNTYKVLCILLNWYRNSKVNEFFESYLSKNSSLKHSVTYRICSKLFSFFNKLWDRLYNFGICCGNSSCVISFIKNSFCKANSFIALALMILFFSFGFGVTTVFLGSFNAIKAILVALGILTSLLLFCGNTRWATCLKSSMFWRFALYIFD